MHQIIWPPCTTNACMVRRCCIICIIRETGICVLHAAICTSFIPDFCILLGKNSSIPKVRAVQGRSIRLTYSPALTALYAHLIDPSNIPSVKSMTSITCTCGGKHKRGVLADTMSAYAKVEGLRVARGNGRQQ
jgi:hypothetical protein